MTFLRSERPQTISDIVGTDLTSMLRCSSGSLLWHSRLARRTYIQSKTSFEKNCFSAWASTLNMGLINKVDMVCLSPVGYGV